MQGAALCQHLRERAGTSARFLLAIAGPPGSGKSTLAEQLKAALQAQGESTIVVPMDGFHFDDRVLEQRGHRARKGAPHTFDARGFRILLERIKAGEADIAIPVFDRSLELSRAAAEMIAGDTRFILVEGNYLLLNEAPWHDLHTLFDYRIFLNPPVDVLVARLMQRWLGLGKDQAAAQAWVSSNDMPNVHHVLQHSIAADLVI